MNDDLAKLSHLKSFAVRAKALIAEVAQTAAGAMEELDGIKADKPTRSNATLAVASWKDNTESATKAAYPKRYTLSVSGATANDSAKCELDPASMAEAAACGMCPSVNVTAGYVVFYAQQAPTADITVQFNLVKCT